MSVAALALGGFDQGLARPGGVYATQPTSDPAACAQACASDGLCMAWMLRDNLCELKAVAPAPIADSGAISGLSARAPDFARHVAAQAPATAPPPAMTPNAPPAAPHVRRPEPPAHVEELLGGPPPPSSMQTLALRLDLQ